MQKTLITKLSIIAALCVIFAVALTMISSLIYERQQYSDQVLQEIAEQHVSPQQIITPFIVVPSTHTPSCTGETDAQKSKCPQPYTNFDTFFANQTSSEQTLDVSTDTYKRGIYHATSYKGNLTFDQSYSLKVPTLEDSEPNPAGVDDKPISTPKATAVHWDQARLILPVSDLRGVSTLPTVIINHQKIKATYPQTTRIGNLNYVETKLPNAIVDQLKASQLQANQLNASQNPAKDIKEISFKAFIDLPLSGISTLNTVPTGQNFELAMSSNWHAPNFIGKALPNAKNLTNSGFNANWQNQYLTLSNNQDLARCFARANNDCRIDNYIAVIAGANDYNSHQDALAQAENAASNGYYNLSSFGVTFAEPNDVYLQTERTMKYALLLILVSFGTFFLFEIIKANRIHPIQYLLVGSALLVFYVLLLPLAEQISFWMAYVIAASACVGLIGWYSYYLLGSAKRALLFTSILSGLYATFYTILTIEDLNLLLGAVFCFVLLASVMIMTRKIDWYKVA